MGTTPDSWGWDLGRGKVDNNHDDDDDHHHHRIHSHDHHRCHHHSSYRNFQAYHDSAKLAGIPYPASSLPTVDNHDDDVEDNHDDDVDDNHDDDGDN